LYYDPLIAKLAAWGKTREEAIERLKRALAEFQIAGVTTNISLLKAVCENYFFKKGEFDINFVEKEFADGLQSKTASSEEIENAAAIISALLKARSSSAEIKNTITDNNKWTGLSYE
jgi:acetyl/propionyl-CoA carboxylase alpha subunit